MCWPQVRAMHYHHPSGASKSAASPAADSNPSQLPKGSSTCSSKLTPHLPSLPAELERMANVALSREELLPSKGWCSDIFRSSLRDYVMKQVEAYKNARKRMGLPMNSRGRWLTLLPNAPWRFCKSVSTSLHLS